jgi:hypothetical protein
MSFLSSFHVRLSTLTLKQQMNINILFVLTYTFAIPTPNNKSSSHIPNLLSSIIGGKIHEETNVPPKENALSTFPAFKDADKLDKFDFIQEHYEAESAADEARIDTET